MVLETDNSWHYFIEPALMIYYHIKLYYGVWFIFRNPIHCHVKWIKDNLRPIIMMSITISAWNDVLWVFTSNYL